MSLFDDEDTSCEFEKEPQDRIHTEFGTFGLTEDAKAEIRQANIMILAYMALSAIVFLLIKYSYLFLSHQLSGWHFRAVGFITIVAASGILFYIRIKMLQFYVILEIVFGLGTCWASLSDFEQSLALKNTLGLGASAYLIVRGLDNYKKHIDTLRQNTP